MIHETRNTTAVSAWCNVCGKKTLHRVSDRRRGTCLEHEAAGLSREQERRKKQEEREEREPRLL